MMRRPDIEANAAGEAFWRFSLALYARPGVAAALIALQDRAGRNVNLMLFALWLGATRGQTLDAAALTRAEAAIAPMTAIAEQLRGERRRLKAVGDPAVQAMRRRIAALEIAAERRVQYRLAATAGAGQGAPAGDRLAAAEANLAQYLGRDAGSAEAHLLREALRSLSRRGGAA